MAAADLAAAMATGMAHAEQPAEHLVDARLLEVAGTDTAGDVRYRQLALPHLFARERLLEDEPDESRGRAGPVVMW